MVELDCVQANTRYPGEYASLKDFITPHHLMVKDLASTFTGDEREIVFAMWKWVGERIRYPEMSNGYEYRRLEAFTERGFFSVRPAVVLQSQGDFWDYPTEVLSMRISDCDGTAFLLTSLLLNQLPPERVFAAIGNINIGSPQGHAWVEVEIDGSWYVLESTKKNFNKARFISIHEASEYNAVYRFNSDKIYMVSDELVLSKCRPCCPLWI